MDLIEKFAVRNLQYYSGKCSLQWNKDKSIVGKHGVVNGKFLAIMALCAVSLIGASKITLKF